MRPWPLAVGLLLLAGLWLGPLAEMARRAFSPHMILHLGVMVGAAPLIIIGVLRLLPGDFAPRHRYLGAFAASVYDFAVVWGWHLPVLHEAAARMNSAFAVQQLSFLTAGLALWWVCLAGRDARSDAAGAFAMLFASMHMAMLGVLLVLAQTLIYALCSGRCLMWWAAPIWLPALPCKRPDFNAGQPCHGMAAWLAHVVGELSRRRA